MNNLDVEQPSPEAQEKTTLASWPVIVQHGSERRDDILFLQMRRKNFSAVFYFKPDPEHINALPDPLRNYIHDLETRADPSGDVAQIASLTEQRDALVVIRRELEERISDMEAGVRTMADTLGSYGRELDELRKRRDELIEANNAEVERRRTAEIETGRAKRQLFSATRDIEDCWAILGMDPAASDYSLSSALKQELARDNKAHLTHLANAWEYGCAAGIEDVASGERPINPFEAK